VAMEILGGGWGACAEHDGADALDNPISNCANAPIEALETDYSHFRIDEYALVSDSGGEGRMRGGDPPHLHRNGGRSEDCRLRGSSPRRT
jgi:N-methylhydantoinase B